MYWDSMQQQSYSNIRMTSSEDCVDLFRMDDFENKEDIRLSENCPRNFATELTMSDVSPARMSCDGSPSLRAIGLEDFDPNSQDSGYEACDSVKHVSPKSRGLSFGSLTGDEFLDLSDLEQESDDSKMPGHIKKLLTGNLLKNTSQNESPELVLARPTFRRALSMITPNDNTPNNSKARSCLFKSRKSPERIGTDIEAFENIVPLSSFLLDQDLEARSFKRPEPPTELQNPINFKRSKGTIEHRIIERKPAKPLFTRCMSATEDSIKTALQRSTSQPDLIGDFSKPYCLPIIPGRHQDLKSITPATLARLINGEFSDSIGSFKVLDCRYPYEFEAGHINGAENIYNKQQIIDELMNRKITSSETVQTTYKRDIVVFHCEFSSERAPNLYRYLRNIDRIYNKDFYPYLHYPEIYLLDGGYKSFFGEHSTLCAPNGYVPMNHPDHEHNLRHFRTKSKTWNADSKYKSLLRSASFKRL